MPLATKRPPRPGDVLRNLARGGLPPGKSVSARRRAYVLDIPFNVRGLAQMHKAAWDAEAKAYIYHGDVLPTELDAFRSQPYSWERLKEDELNDVTLVPSVPTKKVVPRDHQREAVEVCARAKKAGRTCFLNADDVGLGKTIEAWLTILENFPEAESILIVCPLAVVAHWRRTIEWMGDAGKRIVVINYDRLKKLFDVPVQIASQASKRRKAKRKVKTQKGIARYGEAYEFDLIIWDESHKCFPYQTEVATDAGSLPIGEIVEKNLDVRVLSSDTATGERSYKRVTSRIINYQDTPLLEIHHESGSLVVTGDHPIWTREFGYTPARVMVELWDRPALRALWGKICDVVDGSSDREFWFNMSRLSGSDAVPLVPDAIPVRQKDEQESALFTAMSRKLGKAVLHMRANLRDLRGTVQHRQEGQGNCSLLQHILLDDGGVAKSGVPHESFALASTSGDVDLPELREAVQACKVRPSEILHGQMRKSAQGQSAGRTSAVRCAHDEFLPRKGTPSEGQVDATSRGAHATSQSNAQPDNACEDDRIDAGADIFEQGRQWKDDNSTIAAGASSGAVFKLIGIRYLDSAEGHGCKGHSKPADQLQGGHRISGSEVGHRGGWRVSPETTLEILGQAEAGNARLSRMVGYAVHEPKGNGGSGESSYGNTNVYSIEVEGNHNYFASGVLVSNCRNLQTARSKLAVKLNAGADFLMWLSATAGQHPLELAYLAPLLSEATGARSSDLGDFEKWCEQQDIGVSRGAYGKWSWRGDSDDPKELEAADRDLEKMRSILFDGKTPSAIRRTPADIKGWPEINRILLPVALEGEDLVLYRKAWDEFRHALNLERSGKDSSNGLVARLRFRQKSSLLRTASTVDLAEELLEQRQQVAISVAFRETLAIIREALEKSGYKVSTIDGDISPAEKERQRLDFQYGRTTACVYTVEEGISLHQGEYNDAHRSNIMHDLRWSAIQAKQIEGRTHRDGKFSQIYWMLGAGTVEEEIAAIVAGRIRSMSMMQGDRQTVAAIEELLGKLAETASA